MKKNGILNSLPFRLLLALVIGIVVGLFLNKNDTSAVSVALLNIIVTVKYIEDMKTLMIVASKARIMSAPVVEYNDHVYSMEAFLQVI